jgi:hypothetical protein
MVEGASLDNLRDIVVPDAPPVWPLAIEAWLLLAISITAVAIVVYQWRTARAANAYRRAGLVLLQSARSGYEVSVILKRVALAVFPREQVASLYGEEWAAFLCETCGRRDFAPLVQAETDAPVTKGMKRLARIWIQRHRVPSGPGSD